jgi:polyisoprenoid-binding protein YceI
MQLDSSKARRLAGALIVLGALAPAAEAASYTIDPVHSSAMFKIRHFDASNVYGAFWDVSGTVTYDTASEADASIRITITAGSLDTNNERRDAHISSPDFLDAKQFPTIEFESTAVRPLGEGRFEVVGDLTLHGVTKEITATAEKVGQAAHPRSGKQLIGLETRFTFNRSDFDIEFMLGPLSDEVEIIVSIEAGEG